MTDPGPAPRALLFDIGRVIVRVNVERALSIFGAGAGLTAGQVWSAIQTDPRFREWQEGRIEPREWHRQMSRRFGVSLSFEEFCAAWNSSLDPQTILGEDVFAALAARYCLGLLSNTDPLHVGHMEAHFGFMRHFPFRVYSCTAGASKPHPAIYERAMVASGVPPELILYVDDVPEYVEAGRRAGMQALLFESAEQLLDEFRRRSILLA